MKTKLVCLLDKEWPPSHSFVDGMLAGELQSIDNLSITLVVSSSQINFRKNKVKKYIGVQCIIGMYPRKNIFRFLNLFKAYFILKKLSSKYQNDRLIIFVRNEPIYLLASSIFKRNNMSLIFQNSFPHEEISGSKIKRYIAKFLYRLSAGSIDSLLAVSPKGLERLRNIFSNVDKGECIPLLSDNNLVINESDIKKEINIIKFVYIGDHSSLRKLDVVLRSIVNACKENIDAKFYFIGGKVNEIDKLRQIEGVEELIKKNKIEFIKRIPRDELWELLKEMDIGISLIPPDDHYIEASPTKLTEYMSLGLMTIGSSGIPLQEEFILNSKGGRLVKWDEKKITDIFLKVSNDKSKIVDMKYNSLRYAKNHLNYKNYTHIINKLLM
ncbi:MAG: glycosyltransferase [Candidatus Paceibacterota bacterium]